MSLARRTVEEYTALLARAFNGAIEVDGDRIVAHPSGTLLTRPGRMPKATVAPVAPEIIARGSMASIDRDNDWSDV
jgi:hypothetical protein